MNLTPKDCEVIADHPLGSTLDRSRGFLKTSDGLVDDETAALLFNALHKSPVAESLKPPGLRYHLKFYLNNALGAINSLPLDEFGPLAAAVRDGRPDEEIWDAVISLVQVLGRLTSQRGLMSTMGALMGPLDRLDAGSSVPPTLPDKFDKEGTTFTQCCYNYHRFLIYFLTKNALLKGQERSPELELEIRKNAGDSSQIGDVSSNLQSETFVPQKTFEWPNFTRQMATIYRRNFKNIIETDAPMFHSPYSADLVVGQSYNIAVRGELDLSSGIKGSLLEPCAKLAQIISEHALSPQSFKGGNFQVSDQPPFGITGHPTRTADALLQCERGGESYFVIAVEVKAPGRYKTGRKKGKRLEGKESLEQRLKANLANPNFLSEFYEMVKRVRDPETTLTVCSLDPSGLILCKAYSYMLRYPAPYAVITDGYFLLVLAFNVKAGGWYDFGTLKYHFTSYDDSRDIISQDLRLQPKTPLTLLLCLLALTPDSKALERLQRAGTYIKGKEVRSANAGTDMKERDSRNPSRQSARLNEIKRAPGSQTISDATHRQVAVFCTPICLEGLCRGGYLDPGCPNFEWHRRRDRSVSVHQLTVEQVKERLLAQMDSDDESLFANLGYMNRGGVVGMPFRITLNSHGYTMVGKGVSKEKTFVLTGESDMYDRLERAQGKVIPVSLGILSTKSKVTFFPGKTFQSFLLLSWGGDQINGRKLHEAWDMVGEAEEQLDNYGVSHNDLHCGNILWHPGLHRPFIIDLDRATPSRDMDKEERKRPRIS